MSTTSKTTQMAALLVTMAASCAAMAQSSGYGTGAPAGSTGGSAASTVRNSTTDGDLGTGSGQLGAGTVAPSGNLGGTGDLLETLPPTAAGVDSAPSTVNPDKGPHTAARLSGKRRSGDSDPSDPHQILKSMDGEGSSGVPSRSR